VGKPQEIDALLSERRRLDVELSNLIDFVAKGEGLLHGYEPRSERARNASRNWASKS
jgi:hypothetical protein